MSDTNKKKIFIEPEHELTQRSEFQQRNYQIIRIDGKNCFVEVMTGQFHKGKVILNFEQYDESKAKGERTIARITYFVPFDKFLQLEQDIMNAVYVDLTGTSSELLKKNNQARPDGNSESRQLKLIPGLKADFMLQAEKGAGEKSATGIIKPLYGNKPEQKVAIPMSGDDLKKLFSLTKVHINGYIASQYNVRAIKIQEERENININESLKTIEYLKNKLDESNKKIDSLNNDIKKLSDMIIKIGKIVSEK